MNGSAQIVTLCKDSLHADWTLIIACIDANIEYTIVVDNMQMTTIVICGKDHTMSKYYNIPL